ncbi:hypothetical protein MTO96_044818, partial [Rhipicephalus appendiculatus]
NPECSKIRLVCCGAQAFNCFDSASQRLPAASFSLWRMGCCRCSFVMHERPFILASCVLAASETFQPPHQHRNQRRLEEISDCSCASVVGTSRSAVEA